MAASNLHENHRARMQARVERDGLESLAEHEALEYLLYLSIPRMDTNELAHRLIEHFGDFCKVMEAEPEELAQAQAKKKGRLVVLPCDVGDKLYDVTLGEVREKIVISLSMLLSKSVNHLVIHAENFRNAVTSYELQDIGKTVFLTREAAEAALKEREAEHDR